MRVANWDTNLAIARLDGLGPPLAITGRPATDDDIRDAFSTIRRRPDGRSLGPVHAVLWQAVALAVGLRADERGRANRHHEPTRALCATLASVCRVDRVQRVPQGPSIW